MFATTYEDVVRRDQPWYWWKIHRPGNAVNRGIGTNAAMQRGTTNAPFGAPSIPGSAQPAASWCSGNISNATRDGWYPVAATITPSVSSYYTMEVWVLPHTAFTLNRLYSLMSRSFGNGPVGLLAINNKVRVYGGQQQNFDSSSELMFNGWNHVVAVGSNDANQPTWIWVNGQATRGQFTTTLNWWLFGAQLFIGSTYGADSVYSPPAILAEPAVYTYALTPSQILDHYKVGLGMRRRQSMFAAVGYPFPQAPPPPPPPPGGLTAITEGLPNRRVLLVSDRPR